MFLTNIRASVIVVNINQLCRDKNAALRVTHKTKSLFLPQMACAVRFLVAKLHTPPPHLGPRNGDRKSLVKPHLGGGRCPIFSQCMAQRKISGLGTKHPFMRKRVMTHCGTRYGSSPADHSASLPTHVSVNRSLIRPAAISAGCLRGVHCDTSEG